MSPFPVYLHLLSDRDFAPAAVRLVIGDDPPGCLQMLINQPEFVDFASKFPCLISVEQAATLPDELRQTLIGAGCQLVDAASIHSSDHSEKPVLPPEALWLDGRWYLAPPPVACGGQNASRALELKMLQLVMADADTREIEDIFRQDPTLSYKLLRLVNSIGIGATRSISSFAQAILILGRRQLRRWLNLMLFAAGKNDHRSAMLLARVAIRARSMELLARAAGLDRSGQELSFMAGMFSLLGILFGISLGELLKPLQLGDALLAAVLRREGDIGQLLQAVELAEKGDGAGLFNLPAGLTLSPAEFILINLEAHQWMLGIIQSTKGDSHA